MRFRATQALILTGLGAGCTEVDHTEALLRLHHDQRVAHVLGDARMLVQPFDDTVTVVNGGRVARHTPVDARWMFDGYLSASRFLEWEDIRPPRVAISADRRWAEVVVEKRVRLVTHDSAAGPRQDQARFAWAERWRRTGQEWRLVMIASTERRDPDSLSTPVAESARAFEVLRRARAAMGGEEAVARVAMVRFRAECTGPNGPFLTSVWSARDGRVRFLQEFPDARRFAVGVNLGGEWQQRGTSDPVDSLHPVLRSMVSGHEMHLLALAPESRYSQPAAVGRERFEGRDADLVRFRDPLGAPVDFLYDPGTGLPLGFRPPDHSGQGSSDIVARFGDWRAVGTVQLPFAVTITQGEDRYEYRITEAAVAWLSDAVFQPDGPP